MKERHDIGLSRGGKNTKVHALVDRMPPNTNEEKTYQRKEKEKREGKREDKGDFNYSATTAHAHEAWEDAKGFPVSSQEYASINQWLKEFPDDVVCKAIERAAYGNAHEWRYVEKILHDWKVAGVKTLAHAEAEIARFQGGKNKPPQAAARPPSSQPRKSSKPVVANGVIGDRERKAVEEMAKFRLIPDE